MIIDLPFRVDAKIWQYLLKYFTRQCRGKRTACFFLLVMYLVDHDIDYYLRVISRDTADKRNNILLVFLIAHALLCRPGLAAD